jgi:hypothetical protein
MQETFTSEADVARAMLTLHLKKVLEATQLKDTEAGKAVGLSRVAFNHIVNGRNLPTDEAVRILVELSGLLHRLQPMLGFLAVARTRPSRGRKPAPAVKTGFNITLGLEQSATHIKLFESGRVPGLLHIREYAWHQLGPDASLTVPAAEDLEADVERWMRRQSVLTRDGTADQPTVTATFVIEEAALRRPVGGAAVMRKQLHRLAEWTEHSAVEIRVVPTSVGVHPAVGTTFQLFTIDTDLRVAVDETLTTAYYYDKPGPLTQYDAALGDLLSRRALPAEATADLMVQIAKEL